MSTYLSSNIPVHSECMISYPYGEIDASYSCGWHTGVDIVPHGSTENNPWIYPCFSGTVVQVNLNELNALGIYILIYDGTYYWRYCHLMTDTVQVLVNDVVDTTTRLARMDSTGNVTGRHLHLECATTPTWQCATFVNPCDIMDIPNIDDQVLDWIQPVPPVVIDRKHKFKWVLYANKLRGKY